MLLIPFILSVILSLLVAIIFMTRKSRDAVNRWLSGGIIITVVIQSAVFFVMSTGRLTEFWYLFRIGCPLYYLSPPLVYLYVSFILKKERKPFKHYLIHFIPFAVSVLDIGWYYVATNSAERMQEIATIQNLPSAELYLGAGFLPSVFHYYFRLVQRIYYVSRQWTILMKEYAIFKMESPELKWAILLTSAQTLIMFGYGYYASQIFLFSESGGEAGIYSAKQISVLIILLGMIAICMYLFAHPELLYGSIWKAIKPNSKAKIKNTDSNSYDWLPSGTNIQDYCGRLEAYMLIEKPFLTQRISLAFIANEVRMPAHLLSSILNKHYGKSFNDFINEYRINHILLRIREDAKWDQLTMEGIALEAGFSSRTGFYTAFKKHTGKSPRNYLLDNPDLDAPMPDQRFREASPEA